MVGRIKIRPSVKSEIVSEVEHQARINYNILGSHSFNSIVPNTILTTE